MAYGFEIAEGTARTFQAMTDGTSTYYLGQLVAYTAAAKAQTPGTVVPLAVAAGAYDLTNYQVIAGIVVGIDDKTQTYDTYGQYVTGVVTQAAQLARDFYHGGPTGMYAPRDPQVILTIAEITPNTVIRGPICETGGTAPTVVTDSGGADTTGYTTAGTQSASSFTPVANTCSVICRTGKNMGLYRTTNDTSTTQMDVTVAFPYDVVSGDTFVRFSLKQGFSMLQFGATPTGMYIDNTLSGGTTNYFGCYVYRISGMEAGKEFAEFRFGLDHFTIGRNA
jgi:hypothetical protein